MSPLFYTFAIHLSIWLGFLSTFSPVRTYVRVPILVVTTFYLALLGASKQPEHVAAVPTLWPLMLVASVALGFLVALPWAMALESFGISGRIIDSVRGAQFGEMLNPELGSQQSPLERALWLAAFAISLSLNLHLKAFVAVQESAIASVAGAFNFEREQLLVGVLYLAEQSFVLSLIVAAPALAVALLLECGLAFTSRFVGRLNATFEFMPLKLLAGLVLAQLSVLHLAPELFAYSRGLIQEASLLLGVSR